MDDNHRLFSDKVRVAIKKEGITYKDAYERFQLVAKDFTRKLRDDKYQKCMAVTFETFRKILQGHYLKRRIHVLSEIISFALEIEGVGEADFTNPKVDLDKFRDMVGLIGEKESSGDILEEPTRQVRKVIFLIKARGLDNASLLLNYFSQDWQMLLFPNVNIPEIADAETTLSTLLAERIGVRSETIHLDYQPQSKQMTSITRKETGDPEKAKKYGRWAKYTFQYCPVKIDDPESYLLEQRFEARGAHFQWSTLSELKANNRIRHHNNDVLEFLSRKYDATLMLLANSFSKRIQTKS